MNNNQGHEFIDGYVHISGAIDTTNRRLLDIREGKLKPLVTSSRKETDKIGGFFPTDQIVIAARTGIGKSAFILHWMQDFVDPVINPYYTNDIIILYDSWEMPMWRNMLRLYSRKAEMTVKTILDYQLQMQQDAFDRIVLLSESFRGYPIYFRNISQSVKSWVATKKTIQQKYPKKTIINVVDHTRLVTKDNEGSEEQLISNFMMAGMKLKLEENMINIFLSQMNRNIESSAIRGEIGKALPVSSDIFGADSVYQCADTLIALHRPGFYGLQNWEGLPTGKTSNPDSSDNLMIECILKQRDGWTGNITRRHNLALNQIEDYN